jgi:outer membrane protein OmpA-like peptidoglycan-associated protein
MRLIIIAIVAILWLLFGYYFVKPCFETDCGCKTDNSAAVVQPDKDATSEIATTTTNVTGPLLFNWNKEGAVTGEGWEARRQAILDGLKADEILEITGQYRADEVNSSTFENLGMARANEVANLFKPPLSDERIRLKGQLVNATDADKISPFKSIAFRNLINTNAIKEVDEKTLIYFPFNSVDKLKDSEVEAYLDDVADRVKKTGERIRLTGHTDNIDSESFNQALGMRRANIVKKYLLSKGVSTSKIITQSKGETQPIATNDTSEGRAQNRRTELEIIK